MGKQMGLLMLPVTKVNYVEFMVKCLSNDMSGSCWIMLDHSLLDSEEKQVT